MNEVSMQLRLLAACAIAQEAGELVRRRFLHINAWDAAAGVLLIEEAGGWTNDFLTAECLVKGNRVIGCTPGLREVLVGAMDA